MARFTASFDLRGRFLLKAPAYLWHSAVITDSYSGATLMACSCGSRSPLIFIRSKGLPFQVVSLSKPNVTPARLSHGMPRIT